jgi:hypothetical protein
MDSRGSSKSTMCYRKAKCLVSLTTFTVSTAVFKKKMTLLFFKRPESLSLAKVIAVYVA